MTDSDITLEKETHLYIIELSKTIDIIRSSIKEIDQIILEFTNKKDTSDLYEPKIAEFNHLKRLQEYTLLIALIGLDLACAIRLYTNRKSNYEVKYSAKNLVITLNEGYKKIYNVINLSGNVEKTKQRDKSFWVKDIGQLIKIDGLTLLTSKYSFITEMLNLYYIENFTNLKKYRDLAVHYDDNPSIVYDMLISLNIEEICLKVIPFMNILKEMTNFCNEMLQKYFEVIQQRNSELWSQITSILKDIKNQLLIIKPNLLD
jgi:hypothetical protein